MHHHTCLSMRTSSSTWCRLWGSLSTRGRMALVLGKRGTPAQGTRDRTVLVLGRRVLVLGKRDRTVLGRRGMAPLDMQSIACHTLWCSGK